MRTALLLVLVAGCAHRAPPRVAAPVVMEPMTFRAGADGKVEILDAATLFERGSTAFTAHQFAESAAAFDRVLSEFPDARHAVPSLYNAGLAYEGLGDFDAAAARYRRLAGEHAQTQDALDALYRLGSVHCQRKRFADAAEVYQQILARKDLSLSDRVEAMARRGVAQFELHELAASEHTLREALDFYRSHESEERLDSDFFLGMGAYYLGEITHAQYRALPVRPPEKQTAKDLEAKARLLLMAQARFLDAMRVNNPNWATAAGFQIGSLYREFYDDLVGAPVPPGLSGEAREVYLEEVRKQVKTLLQKAIAIHEKNILMAERIGEQNEWVKRSNEQMEQLRKLLVPGAAPSAAPIAEPPPAPPLPRPKDDVKPRVVL
jgi:tetratricopeptide (TPR) repeat protein